MRENFYKLGYTIASVLPLLIGVFCVWKIRLNRGQIKKLEEEQKKRRAKSEAEKPEKDESGGE